MSKNNTSLSQFCFLIHFHILTFLLLYGTHICRIVTNEGKHTRKVASKKFASVPSVTIITHNLTSYKIV